VVEPSQKRRADGSNQHKKGARVSVPKSVLLLRKTVRLFASLARLFSPCQKTGHTFDLDQNRWLAAL
jgi:hypothetical protein